MKTNLLKLKRVLSLALFVMLFNGFSKAQMYEMDHIFTDTGGNRDLPAVTTAAVTKVGANVISGGNVIYDGGSAITARGICYGSIPDPDLSATYIHTVNGSGIGSFTSVISSANGTIYVRAYATNANGTAYGDQVTMNVDYLDLPSFEYNGLTYVVAPDPQPNYTEYVNFNSANSYCNNLTAYGYSDWRMPYSSELLMMWQLRESIGGFVQGDTYNPILYHHSGGQIMWSNGNNLNNSTLSSKGYKVETSGGYTYTFRCHVRPIRVHVVTPSVTTNSVTNIHATYATCGGNVTNSGGADITERGICWSTTHLPTLNNSHTNSGSGTGSYSISIYDLLPGTQYYVRAYATNSEGTSYGEEVSFTTTSIPTITTNNVANITSTTAICGGNVINEGSGSVTSRGVCWSTNHNPIVNTYLCNYTSDGSGIGSYTSSITGLTPGTQYYVRAYATNSEGMAYGEEMCFTTPKVITCSVTNISYNSATCGGNITIGGTGAVIARGVCWSISHNPTINNSHTSDGTGTGSYTSYLTDLAFGTLYYVRAYATNSEGTYYYGDEVSFTTAYMHSVTTKDVSYITQTSATCGGYVTNLGNASITARGVCWSSSNQTPTINDSFTSNGTGVGGFSSNLTGLTQNTTYYVRAYATSSGSTVYGETKQFTTTKLSYRISEGGVVATSAGGYFYDSGGPNNEYGRNEHYIMTFTSNQGTGTKIRMTFTEFNVSGREPDYLVIYDGMNTSAPEIGTYCDWSPGTVTATNADGALTFVFISGSDYFVGDGWKAAISIVTPSYFIDVSANPGNGGTVSGVGTYECGETCTLTATANEGYTFINWTENNEVVSTEAEYTFTVGGDRTLVANFEFANITFADANAKALCVANWDTNGDGELSYAEAAAVTDLGDVFAHNYYIVTFDELQYFTGLTTIGNSAFAWCHGLTSVVLPSTITAIGNQAFYDCRNLLSITIPAAVSSIDSSALSCENMETIVVEEGNTIYDSRDNCNAVIITSSNELLRGCKNTVIPNTVISLGVNAFASCAIESISIPASVVSISNTTFYACENIETITVDANNIVYDSRNNCNAIIETSTNQLVAGSKTTVIPNTVTSIGEKAFSYRFRWGSYEITIPESVTSIGASAYLGGYGIVSFSVLAEVPPTLGNNVFEYVYKDIPVYVPCGTRSAYQAAEGWSEFTNIIVDPECGRQITASVNPANTGSVTGAGSYDVGDICTLTATPEYGYRFVNWTENNEVVSTNATYQFTVNANRDLVANFEEYVVTNHYVCDITQFADYMSVVAVVVIDGVEQESETLEIGAFSGDECRGGKFATYFPPTQRYIYQLPVYGEGGDEITFRLYNHDTQEELTIPCTVELQWQKDGYGRLATPYEITFISSVNINASVNPANAGTITGAGTYMPGETATLTATANAGYVFANWTEGGNVVSQNATYSFTVTTARDLVANFNAAQSYTLNSGWNWFSTYIEQNGIDGLSMLEEGLGEHGEFIQSRTGAMVENFDGSFWWGDLNAVTNEDMYEVKTNAQVSVTMTGSVANPASHPITVAPGWNWIGYVSDATKSVDNALSSLTPNEDDVIQGRNAFSSYFPGWGWYGDLENMTPGQGYMYKSNGTASQTLVYPTATRSTNTDIVDYHYNANYNKYRDVMDVMAKVIVNGDLPTSDRYELAAFVNGECRGRAKLQYVEPMQTYLAFITINGNDDETVTFSLYDEDLNVTYYASEANIVVFNANEVVGKFRNPYILSFNNAENVENTVFTVYPNPVAQGDEMTVNLMEEIAEAEMFVENELGLTVDAVKLSGKSAKVRFDWPSGVYVLRVVVDGNVYYNKVIVK